MLSWFHGLLSADDSPIARHTLNGCGDPPPLQHFHNKYFTFAFVQILSRFVQTYLDSVTVNPRLYSSFPMVLLMTTSSVIPFKNACFGPK